MTQAATSEVAKPLNQMTLKQIFDTVYGGKHKFSRKNPPMFERLDAVKVAHEVNHDPTSRTKRPLMREHYKYTKGRLKPYGVWPLSINGEDTVIVSRNNKSQPAVIENRATGKITHNAEFVPFYPESVRGARYPTKYFAVHSEERYYAMMLSPYSWELSEALGEKSGLEIVRLFDPNYEIKKKVERMQEVGRARAALSRLFVDNPKIIFAIANHYNVATAAGSIDYEPEVMLDVMNDLFSVEGHKPPFIINAKTFQRDVADDKFRWHLLAETAIRMGVVRMEAGGSWYYMVRKGSEIQNKVPIGSHIPHVHGNDRRRPLLEYLSNPENRQTVSLIESDSGFSAGRMLTPLETLTAPMKERQEQLDAEAIEAAAIKSELTQIYKDAGKTDMLQRIKNMGISKLRALAQDEQIEGYKD